MKFKKDIYKNNFNIKDRKRNYDKINIVENLTFVRFSLFNCTIFIIKK